MDYDKSNAESLMHEHGMVAFIVHKDQLSRSEKDVVRAAVTDSDSNILAVGKEHYVLFIPEEPDTDELALASFEEFKVDQENEQEPVLPPNTPVVPEDLDGLTVAQLKEIADAEEVDISDVKLKADIVGRIWATREMREQEQEG